ncbi:calcium-binding protein [Chamaesiphon sp. VAR_48_metabat_403]|uniref:calcium-binding protein n=1 Tax=Chamaesiphon sp. VAR_48_metabat_403 TaxID=2964700 RepID=UPI00286D9982|nr:calcium-binding protein [Chamaesiphon sp. VAR_48_metabat_403]
MASLSFDTTQPSQVKGLNGYTVDPIFTVGDKIGDYVPAGILDGIGAYALNDTTVRLLVVNEVASTDGYKYSLKNGTQLPGARVNYFDVDKRTLQITGAGLAHDTIINRAGEVVDAATDLDFGGIQRFCSAALFEANQFGTGIGLADRIFFSGEETLGGTQFALDTKSNTLYAAPAFGRAGWENVSELNTGRTDKVAFMIGDDGVAPLSIYIGDKNAKKDGSFLDRNGLAQGKLFVWVADDPADANDIIELKEDQFKGNNTSKNGKFVEIAYFDAAKKGTAVDGPDADTTIQNDLGYDALGYATYAQQIKLANEAKAFFFSRVEDVSTNPKDGTQAAFAVTGVDGTPNVDGVVYRVDVDFDFSAGGIIKGKVDILNDGNLTKDAGLRSPDNLDWADDGKIYINEDRANSAALFAGNSKQEASLFSIDPAVANPSSTLTRIAQVDRTALPATQTDASPTDIGNWETSGILDVSSLFGAKPGELFVFDVQAHSLRDGSIITATNIDGNNDGTKTRQENLVEGGQLSFLIAPKANLIQGSNLFGGTSGNDTIEAGITKGFDGINDSVFAGAGNDTVDSVIAGVLAGNNRIDTGSGTDTIYVANNDRVFGQAGDDIFEASDASGYRVSGGAGNDTIFLGKDGRALGGDGADKFFAGIGGGNTLSGGAGADQFWIYNGEAPASANTVVDFQIGTDVLGITGGVKFADLTRTGNNIAIGGNTIATLTGVDTTTLTSSNFAFI